LYNRLNIEQALLQIYVSALLFAPINSVVCGLFSVEEPSWVLTKPAVEQSWNLCFQTLEGHSSSVLSVAFSPDGSRIASGSYDRTVKIWDAKSGKEIRTLEGHSSWVNSVAFSPDGSRIASGSHDRTVKIWDAKSGKEIRTLEGHSGSVRSVAFSPDGSRIASGSHDRTVKIWDAKSGKEILTLEGHSRAVFRSHFKNLSDSELRPQTNAGGTYLNIGSFTNNHSVSNYIGERTSSILELDQRLASNGIKLGWDLSGDGSWITWCGRGAIWLPPNFRPEESDVSRDGSAIAIGCQTGRIVVMRMSLNMPFS